MQVKPQKPKKPSKAEVAAIEEKLKAAIQCINDNPKYLDTIMRLDLQFIANGLGFSLVQSNNLAEYFQLKDFCEINNLEFINYNF